VAEPSAAELRGAIKVVGLRETITALRAIDESMVDIVQAANKKAAEVVAERAQALASSLGKMQARAAATLKPASLQKMATLRLGNKEVPFALGAEFGAYRNQPRESRRGGRFVSTLGWNQFEKWRGSDTGAGYFLWPSIRDNRAEILAAHENELDRLLRFYFPGGLPSGATALD
jgi:hypothetical protein